MKRVGLIAMMALLMGLSACSALPQGEAAYPKDAEDQRREARGRLTGEGGLFSMGGSGESAKAASSPLGVNSFLWRATLDTLAFMPIASADPFGGVIITDWYEDPGAAGERFKVNALILDRSLRADGVKISVFKQNKDASGQWKDQPVDIKLARQLEDTVLTRARQLKVSQQGK